MIVSDTAPRRNALYPDLWQINDSLKEPVRSMLAENYGVHSESFGQQLADVAGKLVQSYWDNNSSDILGIVDGSYLMSYDDAGRELQFKSAAAMGVTYMLLERCGLDPAGWLMRRFSGSLRFYNAVGRLCAGDRRQRLQPGSLTSD